MKIQWASRLFSKGHGKDHEVARKAVTEITKLAHVRLDLGKVTSDNILPLVRQNVKNRKAEKYANPDLVATLHHQYRTLQFEVDQLRRRRNEHAALAKQIVTMDDDDKRESMMEQHTKVGKSYKK